MIDTAGVIHTVVGTGIAGYTADGGNGDTARLNYIGSVRIDKAGNIFFGDNLRIRKISTGRTITTLAGNGTLGFSGDGGPAINAQLGGGIIDIDTLGNIFIAEQVNNRVRKVNGEGIINTIAGTGIGSYNGDGISPLLSNVSSPHGITVNRTGDVFIGDQGNNRVRMISYTLAQTNKYIATGPGMRITPNPCSNNCTMSIQAPMSEGAEISITDVTGREVHTAKLPGGAAKVTLEVSDWAKGTYLVQVTNKGERVLVEKVVIQ